MSNKAFTLIELMVVLSIIGLLATFVMVNMQSTRHKANDANIQSYLHQVRNAAEFLYIKSSESYASVCDEINDTLSDEGEVGILEDAIMLQNRNQPVTCFESADKKDFAVSSPLRAREGKHWCVQTAGLSLELDNPVTSAVCE